MAKKQGWPRTIAELHEARPLLALDMSSNRQTAPERWALAHLRHLDPDSVPKADVPKDVEFYVIGPSNGLRLVSFRRDGQEQVLIMREEDFLRQNIVVSHSIICATALEPMTEDDGLQPPNPEEISTLIDPQSLSMMQAPLQLTTEQSSFVALMHEVVRQAGYDPNSRQDILDIASQADLSYQTVARWLSRPTGAQVHPLRKFFAALATEPPLQQQIDSLARLIRQYTAKQRRR